MAQEPFSAAASRERLIGAYVEGVAALNSAVQGLTAEQFHARPVEGAWSVMEVVCHLADSEALFAHRMKLVLADERPSLLFADPNLSMAAMPCATRDLAEELALIEAVRRQMASILRSQPASAWERIGVHNRQGEQTLRQLLEKAVNHLSHHVRFIDEKRRLMGE
jgi:uncharacterized damage-inducible protein DinB